MIPRVAAEKLVGTFARERDGVVLFDLAAKEQERRVNVGVTRQIARFNAVVKRVGKETVVEDYLAVLRVGVPDHQADVVAVGVRLKQALLKELSVVAVLNGVGVNAAHAVFAVIARGGFNDDRAVKSAREKKTPRHVAYELPLYRVGQQVTRGFDRLGFVFAVLARFYRKVRSAAEPAVFVDGALAGVQLKNALENSARGSSRGTEEEYLVQALFVDTRSDNAACEQGFYLGAKDKTAVVFVIKQRFNADFVAAEKKRPVARVENCEGEDSVQLFGAPLAVLNKRLEHDLGVAVTAEVKAF